ncbi:MAG: hypothetical protein LBR16_06290 [Treponema sp.]|jgi:hypothetical protein|nr:hypothetical protein [Treponema sp.]
MKFLNMNIIKTKFLAGRAALGAAVVGAGILALASVSALMGCLNPASIDEYDPLKPVLSGQSVGNYAKTPDGTTATVTFTSDKTGIYWLAVCPVDTPTPKSGSALAITTYKPPAINARGSVKAGMGTKVNITGLVKGTSYKAHVTVQAHDGTNKYSAVWSSTAFTVTRVTYTILSSSSFSQLLNGITSDVSFSPKSPWEEGTNVTATVKFNNKATERGTFTIALGSDDVSLVQETGNAHPVVGVGETLDEVTYAFTMPANDIDIALTFTFEKAYVANLSTGGYMGAANAATATLYFTSDKAGTYYMVVYPSMPLKTPEYGEQIENAYSYSGIDASYIRAYVTSSATANNPTMVNVTGLVNGTAYIAYVTVKNEAGYSDVLEIRFTLSYSSASIITYDAHYAGVWPLRVLWRREG